MKGRQGLEQRTGDLQIGRAEVKEHKRESRLGLQDPCVVYQHCPGQRAGKITWDENEEGDGGMSIR